MKPTAVNAGRPSNTPQSGQPQTSQPRGGGSNNYHQQNNRGNYWTDNSQEDPSPGHRSGPNVATAPNENQVFVGSLPLEFTRDTLIECFSQFGPVLDAKIHTPVHDNKKVRSSLGPLQNSRHSILVVEFRLRRLRQSGGGRDRGQNGARALR